MDGTNLIFDVINGDLFVVVDFKLKSNGAFSSSSKCSLVRWLDFWLPKYSSRLWQNKHSWLGLKSIGICSSKKEFNEEKTFSF